MIALAQIPWEVPSTEGEMRESEPTPRASAPIALNNERSKRITRLDDGSVMLHVETGSMSLDIHFEAHEQDALRDFLNEAWDR